MKQAKLPLAVSDATKQEIRTTVVNSLNYWEKKQILKITEAVDKRSQTIPDQNLSVRQILRRFGMGLTAQGHPMKWDYEDEQDEWEDDLPTPGEMRGLDRVDRMALENFYKTELDEVKSSIKYKKKSSSGENPEVERSPTP